MAELIEQAQQHRSNSARAFEDAEKERIEAYNRSSGDLPGYDCRICKNKGYIAILRNEQFCLQECRCMKIRRSEGRLKRSGINPAYTLQTFKTESTWQKTLLSNAWKYTNNPHGWFFIGGQVGCGKTHICTCIVRELIKKGMEARYMLWRDDSTAIKASVMYPEEYAEMVEPLKNVEVLYIDDFFKTNSGKPTTADVNLAFEILNARYNRPNLVTIISSEFFLDDLIEMDEAVGSRIYERAKDCRYSIHADESKNYRLRGAKL